MKAIRLTLTTFFLYTLFLLTSFLYPIFAQDYKHFDSIAQNQIKNEVITILNNYEKYGSLTETFTYISEEYVNQFRLLFEPNAIVLNDIESVENKEKYITVDEYLSVIKNWYPEGLSVRFKNFIKDKNIKSPYEYKEKFAVRVILSKEIRGLNKEYLMKSKEIPITITIVFDKDLTEFKIARIEFRKSLFHNEKELYELLNNRKIKVEVEMLRRKALKIERELYQKKLAIKNKMSENSARKIMEMEKKIDSLLVIQTLSKNAMYGSTKTNYGNSSVDYKQMEEWINNGIRIPSGDTITLDAFVNAYDQQFKWNQAFNLLGLSLDLEKSHTIVGGKNYLQIGIHAPKVNNNFQSQLNVCFVIDRSGSMDGEQKLETVKATLFELIDKLNPNDKITIVAFDDLPKVIVSGKSIKDKNFIRNRVKALETGGGTDINGGLVFGIEELRNYSTDENSNLVILLSDGQHNGNTTRQTIYENVATANNEGIVVTTVGYGSDYDFATLRNIAHQGGGSHVAAFDINKLGEIFDKQLVKARKVVAKAIRLKVKLDSSVQLNKIYGFKVLSEEEKQKVEGIEQTLDEQLSSTYNIPKNRSQMTDEGVNIIIPSLMENHYYLVMMEIEVPEGVDKLKIAEASILYKDLTNIKNDSVVTSVFQKYNSDKKNKLVIKNRLGLETAEALIEACNVLEVNDKSINKSIKIIENHIEKLTKFIETYSDSDIRREISLLRKYIALIRSVKNQTIDFTKEQGPSFHKGPTPQQTIDIIKVGVIQAAFQGQGARNLNLVNDEDIKE